MDNSTLNQKEQQNNDVAVNGNNTPALDKKRDIAEMINVSVRSVDNLIADGCPHIKLTPRCVRFDRAEVKAWLKQKYGQQSRKIIAQN